AGLAVVDRESVRCRDWAANRARREYVPGGADAPRRSRTLRTPACRRRGHRTALQAWATVVGSSLSGWSTSMSRSCSACANGATTIVATRSTIRWLRVWLLGGNITRLVIGA